MTYIHVRRNREKPKEYLTITISNSAVTSDFALSGLESAPLKQPRIYARIKGSRRERGCLALCAADSYSLK